MLSALRFMYCCCIVIIRGQTNHHKSRYFVSLAADVSRPSPWRIRSYFQHRKKKTGPISLARQSGFAPRLDSNSARPIVVMCEVLDLGPRARRSRDCWRLSLLRKGRLLRSPSPLHALYGSRGLAHATHAPRARRGGLPASLVLGAACCCCCCPGAGLAAGRRFGTRETELHARVRRETVGKGDATRQEMLLLCPAEVTGDVRVVCGGSALVWTVELSRASWQARPGGA